MSLPVTWEPIPAPTDPANLPSLPGWLRSRLGMVSREEIREGNQYRMGPVLPGNCALSDHERRAIQSHTKALDGLCRKTSLTHPDVANEVLGALARLLRAFPTKEGELTGEAKTEAYMIAIEDLPEWAIRQAIRGWYRGEHGSGYNYTFAPAPADLRELSMMELWKVKGRATQLQSLLDAVPRVEYSLEHRKDMLERIQKVVKEPQQKIWPAGSADEAGVPMAVDE